MDAEKRSPRQWAIDILNPHQPLTLLAFRIIKEMTQVKICVKIFWYATEKLPKRINFREQFLSTNG